MLKCFHAKRGTVQADDIAKLLSTHCSILHVALNKLFDDGVCRLVNTISTACLSRDEAGWHAALDALRAFVCVANIAQGAPPSDLSLQMLLAQGVGHDDVHTLQVHSLDRAMMTVLRVKCAYECLPLLIKRAGALVRVCVEVVEHTKL